MAEVTKKYRIQQKDADGNILTLHPETEAVITLVKPVDTDVPGPNVQKALEQLNIKIQSSVENAIISKTSDEWKALNPKTQLNTIYVYTDAFTYNDGEKDIVVAGIKVGDGFANLNDKAFVTAYLAYQIMELNDEFQSHLADNTRHITSEERTKWNDKLNCNENIVNETLVLNRN